MANAVGRALVALSGAGFAAVGVVLARVSSTSSTGQTLDVVVREVVMKRPEAWRGMRGGLTYVAIPALLVLGALAAFELYRRSPKSAVTYVLCGLAANVSVQAVKHGYLPGGDGLTLLSGHVGVAAAVCLGWLAFSPQRVRGMGWAVGAVVGGVSGGVILASWHTVPQVLCPLGIVTGWVVLGTALLGAPDAERLSLRGPAWTTGLGAVGLTAGLVLASADVDWLTENPWWAVALTQGVVAAATCLAVGIVLFRRPVVGHGQASVQAVAELS